MKPLVRPRASQSTRCTAARFATRVRAMVQLWLTPRFNVIGTRFGQDSRCSIQPAGRPVRVAWIPTSPFATLLSMFRRSARPRGSPMRAPGGILRCWWISPVYRLATQRLWLRTSPVTSDPRDLDVVRCTRIHLRSAFVLVCPMPTPGAQDRQRRPCRLGRQTGEKPTSLAVCWDRSLATLNRSPRAFAGQGALFSERT